MPSDKVPYTDEEKALAVEVGRRDREMSGWLQEATGALAPGVHVRAGMRVVDVGCGDGGYISFCSRSGADVTFVDRQEPKIRALEARLQQTANGGSVEGIVSECNPIPIDDGYADLVISTEVLEHVQNPREFLREIVRIGKADATYFLTVPDARSEVLLKDVAVQAYFSEPNHIQIFSPENFEDLIEACGLEVLRHEYLSGFWSIFNLLKWGTIEPGEGLVDVAHPATYHWVRAWESVLDHPQADTIRAALNDSLPRTQIIVARRRPAGDN